MNAASPVCLFVQSTPSHAKERCAPFTGGTQSSVKNCVFLNTPTFCDVA